MQISESAGSAKLCEKCQTAVPLDLLACPACGALMNRGRLNDLAYQASFAALQKEHRDEISCWREALTLLPEGSTQHTLIRDRVVELSRYLDSNDRGLPPPPPFALNPDGAPPPLPTSMVEVPASTSSPKSPEKPPQSLLKKVVGGIAVVGVLLLKTFSKVPVYFILAKGKLLLAGLKSGSTFLTMFLSFAVYWSLWSWKFALGLVLCIYVHEMGHVWAFRKLGIRSSWPMFVPGLGAFVRGKESVVDKREDARVGLAGPIWGVSASLVCLGMFLITGGGFWAALCRVNAWLNLVNLVPIYPLDGGRGFRAVSRAQAITIAAAFALAWGVSHDGILVLLAAVAVIMAFRIKKDNPADRKTFFEYLILIVVLTAFLLLPVPGVSSDNVTSIFP